MVGGMGGSRFKAALPDGGFLRQIWKILVDLKLSGGQKIFLVDSQFLADFWRIQPILHGFVFVWRIWRILAVLESLLTKNNFFLTFSCMNNLVDKK
jgi:hypothetical protein